MHVRKRTHIITILACSQGCFIIQNNERMMRKVKEIQRIPTEICAKGAAEFCS